MKERKQVSVLDKTSPKAGKEILRLCRGKERAGESRAAQSIQSHKHSNERMWTLVISQDPREGTISAAGKNKHKMGQAEKDHNTPTEHPALHSEAESGNIELF